MGWIFLILVAGIMFLFVVFSEQTDIGYLFDFTRHEWYRELRRDYFTSRAQFWREWRSLKRFAKANGPWIYASLFGTLGLVLTVILLIVNLPQELKAKVRNVYAERTLEEQPLFVTRDGTLDTRTQVMRDVEPMAIDRGLPVLVDIRQTSFEQIARDELVPEPQPVFSDPPPVQPEIKPPVPDEIDFDEAFADFKPERKPEPIPDFEIEISREGKAPELLPEPFVVTSTEIVDFENVFVRMVAGGWEPEDKTRVPKPPPKMPLLYRERHGDVHLSLHERERFDVGEDLIRLRPRAVGREVAPGLLVRKSIAHHAVAGQSLTYEIEVANPHDDAVPGIIVEETVPAGWSIVDATPRAVLVDDHKLRWDISDLEAKQSHRFSIEVVVGRDEAAQSRTVVTTGVAVESVINVDSRSLAPDPKSIDPVPVIVNDTGWQASKTKTSLPSIDEPMVPPTLPPGRRSTLRAATVQIDVPQRVGLGTVDMKFTVTNTGTVGLSNPMLLVWLQKELSHQTGLRNLQKPVGALAPKESRTLTLRVKANAVGAVSNRVQLQAWPDSGVVRPEDRELLNEGEAVFSIETSVSDIKPISYSRWRAVGGQ